MKQLQHWGTAAARIAGGFSHEPAHAQAADNVQADLDQD